MEDTGTSFVVSDKLGLAIDNADLYDELGDDVELAVWDYFIRHSVDFDVLILDMDLSRYTEDVRFGNTKVTESKDEFLSFFDVFHKTISYFLASGDSVVVLLHTPASIVESIAPNIKNITTSDDWLDSLSVLDAWAHISDSPSKVLSNTQPIQDYFQAVSGHYGMEINDNVVSDPDILAESSDGKKVAGLATNQYIDDTGDTVESEGTLILLPQPKSITKPHRIIDQLVDIGWYYHSETRPIGNDGFETVAGDKDQGNSFSQTPIEFIRQISERFPYFARQLEQRRENRETVSISDEHDVQDLFHGLLWLLFDDIRAEEQSPSHGGSGSRIDFLLKEEEIGVEVKLAYKGHTEDRLKNEIAEDKEHYIQHPDCDKLFFFVYDPSTTLANPIGFQRDLSSLDGPLATEVIVSPK